MNDIEEKRVPMNIKMKLELSAMKQKQKQEERDRVCRYIKQRFLEILNQERTNTSPKSLPPDMVRSLSGFVHKDNICHYQTYVDADGKHHAKKLYSISQGKLRFE